MNINNYLKIKTFIALTDNVDDEVAREIEKITSTYMNPWEIVDIDVKPLLENPSNNPKTTYSPYYLSFVTIKYREKGWSFVRNYPVD